VYLIYDIETTGLLTSFDQVTEFAFIICDKNFNVTDKNALQVRLSKDSIPALEALLVTPQLPSLHEGIAEPEALKIIHRILSSQPYNGGYNTIRFDDELLRFSFYRHGLYPYKHQKSGISQRFDILPMVALFYIIHPQALSWPMKDGKITLRLEALNALNGWCMGTSHVALFDVEVTHALASLLYTIDPKLFNYILAYFNKDTDKKRCAKYTITDNHTTYAYLFDPRFGSDAHYIQAYQYHGPHPYYTNQTLWQRLDDPLRVIRKKWGEPPWVMPQHIVNYIERSLTPENITPHPTPLIPPAVEHHHIHDEASLYTSTTWLSSLEERASGNTPYHRFRHNPKDLSPEDILAITDYKNYLLYGEPAIGSDHLGRCKRHLQSISADEKCRTTPAIKDLYDALEQGLL